MGHNFQGSNENLYFILFYLLIFIILSFLIDRPKGTNIRTIISEEKMSLYYFVANWNLIARIILINFIFEIIKPAQIEINIQSKFLDCEKYGLFEQPIGFRVLNAFSKNYEKMTQAFLNDSSFKFFRKQL
ncbi:hypothetical protein BpHYR1_029701 [Brachionus plicatilis]|uniref:Uncharacterized protein n=1 Tax=Brachionus plicatilis TaxID=10195 RepID=A0A3M7T3F8_BRAPC|nr:hypothetical protein BpHYR1_029701 [Brachionus plicatilis]